MKIITTSNLTKYYGKARGIINLNLNVNQGDFFGFIGPNGAGKSTTIRTLLGLTTPTSGTASILNHDVQTEKMEVLSNIGYMPSEAMFYRSMRVKDIISLSAKLHKKDCTLEAKQLCERLSLDTNKRIDALSLGNRKKVAIVCAMQHNPDLYIFDEPTSGLDPLIQKEFFSLLSEKNEAGATIFLSSHVLSEIQKYCSHAAIIKEGKLIACDSVDNLSKTKSRRITLHGVTSLPPAIEAKGILLENDSISFLYHGDMKVLLAQIQELPFHDISITEPDLDEIFMHYYEKEDNAHDHLS